MTPQSFVALAAIPAQTVTASLGGQTCQITVYQKRTGLYLDLAVNNAPIIYGVLCLNANLIVRDAYLGFSGDLAFYDTQGAQDPDYTGLGGRYQLAYVA